MPDAHIHVHAGTEAHQINTVMQTVLHVLSVLNQTDSDQDITSSHAVHVHHIAKHTALTYTSIADISWQGAYK